METGKEEEVWEIKQPWVRVLALPFKTKWLLPRAFLIGKQLIIIPSVAVFLLFKTPKPFTGFSLKWK